MKIIFIIHNITRSGGTEKATLQLSNSFVKRGFDVEIISIASKEGVNIFFEISPKIKVYHINGTGNKIVNWACASYNERVALRPILIDEQGEF